MKPYLSAILPSPDDFRDYEYQPLPTVPVAASLREWTGGIEDQGKIGSCVSNSVVSACELILQRVAKHRDLSRRFHYFNGRDLIGRVGEGGMSIRSGIHAAYKFGLPDEVEYPYSDASELDTKPPADVYFKALEHRVFRYERITLNRDDWRGNIHKLKSAVSEGFPVVIGAYITDQLLTWKPSLGNYLGMGKIGSTSLGGHAMTIVEYTKDDFILENSWGQQWGDNGMLKWGCTGLVADTFEAWIIRGFDSIDCSPAVAYKTDPSQVIRWYHNVGRTDVTNPYDPNVQYWARSESDPDVFYGTFINIARSFMRVPI